MESIELDCAPGTPRPDAYIGGVVHGTGLTVNEPVGKWFGNWTWDFDVPRDEWISRVQPIVAPRIKALYESGFIRYGSW